MSAEDAAVQAALLEVAKDLLQASDDLAASDPQASAKLAREAYEIGRDLGLGHDEHNQAIADDGGQLDHDDDWRNGLNGHGSHGYGGNHGAYTNGHGLNGQKPNGHEHGHQSVNGHTNGHHRGTSNGHGVNGHGVVNGHGMNGHGHSPNGHGHTNGKRPAKTANRQRQIEDESDVELFRILDRQREIVAEPGAFMPGRANKRQMEHEEKRGWLNWIRKKTSPNDDWNS